MHLRHTFLNSALAALAAMMTPLMLSAAAPATYLEYIESDGSSQYIDLGVVGRCNLEVEAELAYVQMPADACFIGTRNGDTRFYALHYWQNSMLIGYGQNTLASLCGMRLAKYSIDSRFVNGLQTLSVNGAVRATRTVSSEYDTGLNLYLFACNKDGSPDYYTKGRIYSLKIWDLADGERDSLLRDFRPCLDGNGVPCLYDAVTDGYFYDARSGTFAYKTLDPPQTATVDHYVEYIQSDGTQFIDTGIIPLHGMKSSLRMSFVQVPADGGILCLRENGHRFYLAYYYPGNKGFFYANSGTPNIPANDHLATAGTIYTIQTDVFRNVRNFNVNGEEVGPRYDGDKTDTAMLTKTLYLFGLHDDDTFRYPSSMKLYECTIWVSPLNLRSDGELVMVADYHPCVDTDGVAGLYDSVSGRILYNGRSGGNAFATGPALATAARVVASNGYEFEGTASPAYGTDDTVAQGDVTTYTCEHYATNELNVLFECVGYTTATSEDGSSWGAESALVESRSAALEYPGGWWRLTWNWQRAGFQITTATPEGATVSVVSQETDYPEGYYVDGETAVFTASETDGDGNTFAGWIGDIPSGVFDARRSIPIVVNAEKSITALYHHAWTIASISGSVTNITDGIWTVEVENGVVGGISEGIGPLDFTNVERDLGFKITSFKSWMPNTSHHGPKNITEIIAPDATSVEALAFTSCQRLTRAVFSPSLKHLGRSAFYNCTSLSSLSPTVSEYLSQAENTSSNDLFVFNFCRSLAENVVVERQKGAGTLWLADYYFSDSGITSIDFSKCRGKVELSYATQDRSPFVYCRAITNIVMNQKLDRIPRGMCYATDSLTDLYITGRLPAPEDIGEFYAKAHHKLRVHISKALNPNVVADLQLREPTDAEKKMSAFPRAAYAAGTFIGVWDTPTTGWGDIGSGSGFCEMWVLDWKPPADNATFIFVR